MRWYINRKAKEGLLNYKYHGSDSSIFGELLTPFWEWAVTLVPLWVAPNVLTLLGFLCSMISVVLFMFTHTNYYGESNLYVYVASSILVFLYQTLDAIDGKQARRTRNGSALGELFDHGCDAFTLFGILTCAATQMQFGLSVNSFWLFVIGFCVGFTSIWEEYMTFVLRFNQFNSVTELQLLFCVILIYGGVFGNWIWNHNLLAFIGYNLKVKQLILLFGLFLGSFNFIEKTLYISKHVKNGKSIFGYRDQIVSIIPYFIVNIFYVVFVFMQKEFVEKNIVLFCSCYGLTMSYLMAKLIVYRICRSNAKLFDFIMIPLPFIVAGLIYLDDSMKIVMFFGLLAFILVVTFHMAVFVIWEICEVLQIRIFTIKRRKGIHY